MTTKDIKKWMKISSITGIVINGFIVLFAIIGAIGLSLFAGALTDTVGGYEYGGVAAGAIGFFILLGCIFYAYMLIVDILALKNLNKESFYGTGFVLSVIATAIGVIVLFGGFNLLTLLVVAIQGFICYGFYELQSRTTGPNDKVSAVDESVNTTKDENHEHK